MCLALTYVQHILLLSLLYFNFTDLLRDLHLTDLAIYVRELLFNNRFETKVVSNYCPPSKVCFSNPPICIVIDKL